VFFLSKVAPAWAGKTFMAGNADTFISLSWLIIKRARFDLGPNTPAAAPSSATSSVSSATIFNRAGMIDRPDRDIETGTAGAGRHRQGGGDGKNERPLPYRSRPRRVLPLESRSSVHRRKLHGWQCQHFHLLVFDDHQARSV
jgi:hypothetical protein